jgi:hypothetical protein
VETPRVMRSGWDVLLLFLVLAALSGLTIFLVDHFGTDTEKAGAILGIVVPAIATIGAAIFGVTVGYSAGNRAGKAEGEEGKQVAVDSARRDVGAAALGRPLAEAEEGLEAIVQTLIRRGRSPAGKEALVFGAEELRAEPLELDWGRMTGALEQVKTARAKAETYAAR